MRWEYIVRRKHFEDCEDLNETMNEMGEKGWEVFSVVCPEPANYNKFVISAKRQILDEEPKLRVVAGRKFR